tara:strand:+ start:298 stop:531 length:234 start_codon:yes stop_codon:yes gene_type:complete
MISIITNLNLLLKYLFKSATVPNVRKLNENNIELMIVVFLIKNKYRQIEINEIPPILITGLVCIFLISFTGAPRMNL